MSKTNFSDINRGVKGRKVIDLKTKKKKGGILKKNTVNLTKKKLADPKKFTDLKNKLKNVYQKKKPSGKFWESLEKMVSEKKIGLLQIGIMGLILIIFLNIFNIYYNGLTLKNSLLQNAHGAFESILSAKDDIASSNFMGAKVDFENALNNIDEAYNKIKFLKQNLSETYSEDATQKLINGIFESGNNLAQAGINFSEALNTLKNVGTGLFSYEEGQDLTAAVKISFDKIKDGKEELKSASEKINSIPISLIPEKYKNFVELAVEKISLAIEIIEESEKYFPVVLKLLGERMHQRYLILFQNSNERRPTGGFIGSYGIIDINNGYITKFEVNDIYDLDGNFHDYVEPPEEIKKLTEAWRMRDSNYSPDFAISAAKAEWFLQQEGGPSADHVIAIDQDLIGKMIKAIGPIKVEGLKNDLNGGDLDFILSYVVESKLTGKTTPKEILKTLKTSLIEEFKKEENIKKIVPVLLDGIKTKQIQIWSKDEQIQEFAEENKIAGRIVKLGEKEDYLNIIDISVGGNKSDKYIKKTIEHISYIDEEGNIINNLTLRKNHGVNEDVIKDWHDMIDYYGYSGLNDHVRGIMGDSPNYAMEKVFVPAGSGLIRVEGIEAFNVEEKYDEELDKTYFYFPMIIMQDATSEISLTYKLPFKLNFNNFDDYILNYQSQAGEDVHLIKKIMPDETVNVFKTYPEDFIMKSPSNITFDKEVSGDFHLSAVLGD